MIPSTLAATSDTDWVIITDLVVILVSAAVVAVVMQRMRLAAIPAYLIAGAVIGPRALGLVPSPEGLGAISHLAIILLLFGIGLAVFLLEIWMIVESAIVLTKVYGRRSAGAASEAT